MQVSKTTSSIGRLFASLDIHYNNSLYKYWNAETKWNRNKKTSNSCWINDYWDSLPFILPIDKVSLNFQQKQGMGKLNGINFNYTYRLQLVLVIRIYFRGQNNARLSDVPIRCYFKLCLLILRTTNWKFLSSFLGFKVIYQRSRNNKHKRFLFTT